jgi:hypothetical protein
MASLLAVTTEAVTASVVAVLVEVSSVEVFLESAA